MRTFLAKFAALVTGTLCGFDRLVFRGSLRNLAYVRGMRNYLWHNRVLMKDFAEHSEKITTRLEETSLRHAQELGREVRYLNSSNLRKEDIAREIAARDRIKSGLICVLRSVDPCMSFHVGKNHETKKLEVRYRRRKCMHLYHYQIHPIFGFMHARIQTWFPFRVYVCINGREWLARQMDQAGLHYLRRVNTFTWLEDVAQAQTLFDQQLQAHWPTLLGGLAEALNPIHDDIFANFRCRYYWSVEESEWASDVMFRSRDALQEVYPQLVRYAVNTFDAVDVLRFLGKPMPASGQVPHRCRHEVKTNLKERAEGIRLKHWVNGNSIKLYDKGSVLRTETTLRHPGEFKVYRPAEGDADGPKSWRPLRLGIADLHRRSEVCQAANARYLEALAAVHDTTPLRQLVEPLCCPVADPVRHSVSTAAAAAPDEVAAAPPADEVAAAPPTGEVAAAPPTDESVAAPPTPVPAPSTTGRGASRPRRVRALNPLALKDATLLQAVSRHEFLVNGLRNRDLRRVLFGDDTGTAKEQRKQSAAVTRLLRLLRAHGLIRKVPKTHRYMVSERGRKTITALLAARNASTEQLASLAG